MKEVKRPVTAVVSGYPAGLIFLGMMKQPETEESFLLEELRRQRREIDILRADVLVLKNRKTLWQKIKDWFTGG